MFDQIVEELNVNNDHLFQYVSKQFRMWINYNIIYDIHRMRVRERK